MPVRKVNSAAKTRKTAPKTTVKSVAKKDEDALMEFEHFVSKKPSNNKLKSWMALILIMFIVLMAAVWLFMSKAEKTADLGNELKFKAIYLDNGQTYFAKVIKEDALNIYLDEVYYIQIEQQMAPAQEEGSEDQVVDVPMLIKRGQELHRPEGLMQINRAKLIAIEEIGAESQILLEINRINQ